MCSAYNDGFRVTGERIGLRAPAMEDASRLAALAGDWEVARNLSLMPHPYALEEAQAFLGQIAGKTPRFGHGVFFIEHARDGLIGAVALHAEEDDLWPEFGYWIGRDHWGQGYATEAARLMLDWAREQGVKAAVAGHFLDNPASGRVLEKAGFLYTGDVRPRPCVARGAPEPTRIMAWLA